MTIEFIIFFPVLMIIFISFLGFSMAFVRQSKILNHVNQVTRAYSVGFFEDEIAAEEDILQYIHDISSMKEVPESTLGYGLADVEHSNGYVTIRVQIPMLRLFPMSACLRFGAPLLGQTRVWQCATPSRSENSVFYPKILAGLSRWA